MKTSPSSNPKSSLPILGITLCFGLIIVVVLGAFFLLPANVNYHVTERYIFSGDDADASVYLGVMLPKSGPYQQVGDAEITWGGDWETESFGFVDGARLSGIKRGDEELIAMIEYDVKLSQGIVSWSAPVKDFQRLPQPGIESDCECLLNKAASLSDGISTMDAYKIYAFTADYLTYSEEDMDCTSISAAKTLEIGSCVCAGYARLMTALCRASDIPSQMVLGLVYPDPMVRSYITSFPQNPDEAHAWVEYYSDGGWKMADPTWGAKRLKLMQFNRIDSRHLAYGELEQVLAVDAALEAWALGQASYILGKAHCFRYIAVSDSPQISFFLEESIQRKWDGRWLNTIIVWGLMTWLLCKFRGKLIGQNP